MSSVNYNLNHKGVRLVSAHKSEYDKSRVGTMTSKDYMRAKQYANKAKVHKS